MSRKAKNQYTHADLYEVLNRPVVKDPVTFPHYTDALLHLDRSDNAKYNIAPRMRKVSNDLDKKLILGKQDPGWWAEQSIIHTEPHQFSELPVQSIRHLLGDITINSIPMIGIILDNSPSYDGAILHHGVLYLDPQNMVRCYIPKAGNAMNPMPGGEAYRNEQTECGYTFLERFGDVQWFKDLDRFSETAQRLLYDPIRIEADIKSRIVRAT